MPHSAYFIVEEFLRSADPQSRKNALTALAVMAEDEVCAERLAESALSDADEGVRKRGLSEIVSLPDASLERAAKAVWDGLKDASTEQNAYAILGHLRGLGKPVPKPEGILSPFKRLALTWGLKNHLYPVRDWAFRMRAWKSALMGGVLGLAAAMIAFFKMTNWGEGSYIIIPIILLMLAVLVCVASTQHATPINLYYDRRSAFIIQVGAAVAYSLLASVFLLLLTALLSALSLEEEEWLTVIIGVPFLIGVVRAATFLSYGVARGKRKNIVVQVAVAAGTIFLLLTALNFLVWRDSPPLRVLDDGNDYGRYMLASGYRMLETAWMALFPVGVAAALSFAVIDSKSAPVRPVAGRLSKIFSYSVVVLSIVLLLVNLAASRGNKYKTANINATFDKLLGPRYQRQVEPPPPDGPSKF